MRDKLRPRSTSMSLMQRCGRELLKFVDRHRQGAFGIHLIFTLNYGPGHAGAGGWFHTSEWIEDNSESLLQHTKKKGFHGIDVLQLGHELNMHFYEHSFIPTRTRNNIREILKWFGKVQQIVTRRMHCGWTANCVSATIWGAAGYVFRILPTILLC